MSTGDRRVDAGLPALLVVGAGGRLGRILTAEALGRGHHVRAVVHRVDPLPRHPRLEVVHGDVHAPRTLEDHVADADAVLVALGSAHARRPDVSGTGARVICRLMSENGPTRLVTVTGSGARLPGEHVGPSHAVKRDQMRHGAPDLLADGDAHLAVLAGCEVEWTTVRVPFMTLGGDAGGTALTHEAPPPAATVPYRAAAATMLDLVVAGAWLRRAPFLAAWPPPSHDSLSRGLRPA